MSSFTDSTGHTWTRSGGLCTSDDGRAMSIVPAMTDAYLLSVIEPPLAVRRDAAWMAIKAMRERVSDEGGYKVTVGGVAKWFHSDGKSKTQQLGLVMAGAAIPAGLQWKTMDGSFVTMTQALASQIFQAAMAQDSAIFAAAETHKAAMQAAATPEAYDFSNGWPAVYQP